MNDALKNTTPAFMVPITTAAANKAVTNPPPLVDIIDIMPCITSVAAFIKGIR